MTGQSPFTPDEAMNYRRQLDTAAEELTEHDERPPEPGVPGEASATGASGAGKAAAEPVPASTTWLGRLKRRLGRS